MAKYIVIGGAGFIGVNASRRVIDRKETLVVVDDLSRRGTKQNLDWLRNLGPLEFVRADIRDRGAMEELFRSHSNADVVLHLAGQVAVTSSVKDPRSDFEINALGSLNILEGVRLADITPLMIYASTNKVYGGMEQIAIEEKETRYAYRDYPHGIPETAPLDFHSPYGCSKGSADQYFHDYHRIYGLPTVVFRQSCIYGPRQFGIEDQGWLAWFMIAALTGRPIAIYGNGKQVRDVLYIDDLLDAYFLAAENPKIVAGKVYNVGGGPECTMSIWAEFGAMLENFIGKSIEVKRGDWRPGDQPVYVSDIRKIRHELGWKPKHSVEAGTRKLFEWVKAHRGLFQEMQ